MRNSQKPGAQTLIGACQAVRNLMESVRRMWAINKHIRIYIVDVPPSLDRAITERSMHLNNLMHDNMIRVSVYSIVN